MRTNLPTTLLLAGFAMGEVTPVLSDDMNLSAVIRSCEEHTFCLDGKPLLPEDQAWMELLWQGVPPRPDDALPWGVGGSKGESMLLLSVISKKDGSETEEIIISLPAKKRAYFPRRPSSSSLEQSLFMLVEKYVQNP